MSGSKRRQTKATKSSLARGNDQAYETVLGDVANLVEEARRASARVVNSVMAATYWMVGARIVEEEQGGDTRAAYGEELIRRLASDLTKPFGRGFGRANLAQMKRFYLSWPPGRILQTAA